MRTGTLIERYEEKCGELLARLLTNADPADESVRLAAAAKLREAHHRFIQNNPHLVEAQQEPQLRAAMEAAIARILKPVAAETKASNGGPEEELKPLLAQAARETGGFTLSGVLAGVSICAAGAAALILSGVASVAVGEKASRFIRFESEYQRSVPALKEAASFLRKVEADIRKRQREQPDELTKTAGTKFVTLATVSPELKLPGGLPAGTSVVVRANKAAYKILFNWPLCMAAAIGMPELVDPKRSNGLSCSNFGVWNEAGKSL